MCCIITNKFRFLWIRWGNFFLRFYAFFSVYLFFNSKTGWYRFQYIFQIPPSKDYFGNFSSRYFLALFLSLWNHFSRIVSHQTWEVFKQRLNRESKLTKKWLGEQERFQQPTDWLRIPKKTEQSWKRNVADRSNIFSYLFLSRRFMFRSFLFASIWVVNSKFIYYLVTTQLIWYQYVSKYVNIVASGCSLVQDNIVPKYIDQK